MSWIVAVDEWVFSLGGTGVDLGEFWVLDEERGGVDSYTCDATVEPEPENVFVLGRTCELFQLRSGCWA